MNTRRIAVAACGVLVGAVIAHAAASPSAGGEFTVRRVTIDAGGGASEGGPYRLRGTIGQSDAQTMAGVAFRLRGGFWTGPGQSDVIFKNGFE